MKKQCSTKMWCYLVQPRYPPLSHHSRILFCSAVRDGVAYIRFKSGAKLIFAMFCKLYFSGCIRINSHLNPKIYIYHIRIEDNKIVEI